MTFALHDNGAWLPLSAEEIVAIFAVFSENLDVDALDGIAKGVGKGDDDVEAK